MQECAIEDSRMFGIYICHAPIFKFGILHLIQSPFDPGTFSACIPRAAGPRMQYLASADTISHELCFTKYRFSSIVQDPARIINPQRWDVRLCDLPARHSHRNLPLPFGCHFGSYGKTREASRRGAAIQCRQQWG